MVKKKEKEADWLVNTMQIKGNKCFHYPEKLPKKKKKTDNGNSNILENL